MKKETVLGELKGNVVIFWLGDRLKQNTIGQKPGAARPMQTSAASRRSKEMRSLASCGLDVAVMKSVRIYGLLDILKAGVDFT